MLTNQAPGTPPGPNPKGGGDSSPDLPAPRISPYFWPKTVLDAAAAFVLLVLTAPLLLLAMVLVKLTSRGPVVYTQTRLGRNGKPFIIYKIRTMVHECESLTGARWSTPGDTRITPVGRWLRHMHLDELPQLWNVLRGDMSLIGPRPERPEFVPHLEMAIPLYRQRLLVRPGVTGLAQVQLPPDSDLDSVRTKLAYDLHYVFAMGFWLDVRIYFATACKLIGAPYRVIRWLFAFPTRQVVDGEYTKRQRDSNPFLNMSDPDLADSSNPVPVMS